MRVAWEKITVVLFSALTWLMVLVAGPHAIHALRHPPRLLAHAGASRRRDEG